ncbi:choline ethanolaminephosphotransferase 1, partial [Lasius niger]
MRVASLTILIKRSFVSLIQLPYTGTEVKVFPLWAAVGIAILLAQSSISVILAGGVGKNGSTVA